MYTVRLVAILTHLSFSFPTQPPFSREFDQIKRGLSRQEENDVTDVSLLSWADIREVHGLRSWLVSVLETMNNSILFLSLISKFLLRNAKDEVFSFRTQGDSPMDFIGLWRAVRWDDAPWSEFWLNCADRYHKLIHQEIHVIRPGGGATTTCSYEQQVIPPCYGRIAKPKLSNHEIYILLNTSMVQQFRSHSFRSLSYKWTSIWLLFVFVVC